ncbi:MAG: hypothetical protein AAB466_01610 [Verrucomicrobiota bacterium]|mgnify:CR=1 FL=1
MVFPAAKEPDICAGPADAHREGLACLSTPDLSTRPRRFCGAPVRVGSAALRLLFAGALLLGPSGCGDRNKVASRVSELEKAFRGAGMALPADRKGSISGETPPAASRSGNAHFFVESALSAVRTNAYADGVMLLQTAQRLPQLTAEQRMAVHQTIRAVTAELVVRAAKGDEKAKAQLGAIERFLSGNQ